MDSHARIEIQKACWLRRNPTRKVEGIERRSTLVDKGVSGGVETLKKHQTTGKQVQSFLHTRKAIIECTNYRGMPLLNLPGKVCAKCLERKCRKTVESKLEEGQTEFCSDRSTTDLIFKLSPWCCDQNFILVF